MTVTCQSATVPFRIVFKWKSEIGLSLSVVRRAHFQSTPCSMGLSRKLGTTTVLRGLYLQSRCITCSVQSYLKHFQRERRDVLQSSRLFLQPRKWDRMSTSDIVIHHFRKILRHVKSLPSGASPSSSLRKYVTKKVSWYKFQEIANIVRTTTDDSTASTECA